MKQLIICTILFCAITLFNGCRETRQKSAEIEKTVIIANDSLVMNLLADTIIYDVIIKNTDPDNKWNEKCIGSLKRDQLIDQLFDAVYNEQADAYNYFSGKKLAPKDLKRLEREKDFKRSKIGKLQFTESWYFDPVNLVMQKKILSVTLGYELPGDDGEIIGYKPVFMINMN